MTMTTDAPGTRALTLQMLAWIADGPRDYADVLEAWRTSCPRLSIWEDACIAGLVGREPGSGRVTISAKGAALLSQNGESRGGR